MHLGSFPCVLWLAPAAGKTRQSGYPEVLIGEFFKYAFRTDYLAPTCADAQVFFVLNSSPPGAFSVPSHVTCFD
ncbi:hypothetical protein CWN50_06715 [Klebsiella michiganensis]|uniref:Uncharacterized protein n=1 Tax=Klebsiella michiganensis TaxID=1134687 RepID=A0A2J4RHJ6_9ENTR|nr:hypothetical protein CWN50_06715 [Klebsiella michiganensis]